MRIGKSLEVVGKRWAAKLLALAIGGRNKVEPAPDLSRYRRVLFARPNFRMGNMLLATPALAAARRSLPGAKIGFLASGAYSQMLSGHPDIDQLHVMDRRMILGWRSLYRLVREIRGMEYDLVVDCSEGSSLLGALFIALSKARYRLGLKGSKHDAFFNLKIPQSPQRVHKIARLLDSLETVGFSVNDCSMKIALDDETVNWSTTTWCSWNVGKEQPCIGLNIGARGDKRWPIECFVDVANTLVASGVKVVVFAGPQELDRLAAMKGQIRREVIVDTTNDPCRFAALIRFCSVFITGDTGPMHLAVAVGAPTLAIFLKSNYVEYRPLGAAHRTLYDREGVAVEQVLETIEEMLENRFEKKVLALEAIEQVG